MRKNKTFFLGLALTLSILSTGCLSIGGKTEVVRSDGMMEQRMEQRVVELEQRIKTLEHHANLAPRPNDTPYSIATVQQPTAMPSQRFPTQSLY